MWNAWPLSIFETSFLQAHEVKVSFQFTHQSQSTHFLLSAKLKTKVAVATPTCSTEWCQEPRSNLSITSLCRIHRTRLDSILASRLSSSESRSSKCNETISWLCHWKRGKKQRFPTVSLNEQDIIMQWGVRSFQTFPFQSQNGFPRAVAKETRVGWSLQPWMCLCVVRSEFALGVVSTRVKYRSKTAWCYHASLKVLGVTRTERMVLLTAYFTEGGWMQIVFQEPSKPGQRQRGEPQLNDPP